MSHFYWTHLECIIILVNATKGPCAYTQPGCVCLNEAVWDINGFVPSKAQTLKARWRRPPVKCPLIHPAVLLPGLSMEPVQVVARFPPADGSHGADWGGSRGSHTHSSVLLRIQEVQSHSRSIEWRRGSSRLIPAVAVRLVRLLERTYTSIPTIDRLRCILFVQLCSIKAAVRKNFLHPLDPEPQTHVLLLGRPPTVLI